MAGNGTTYPTERRHGSASEDEMRARMVDAGYADWEIEEEMAERRFAFKAAAGKAAFHPEGRPAGTFDPNPYVPMRGNACRKSPAEAEAEARSACKAASHAPTTIRKAR